METPKNFVNPLSLAKKEEPFSAYSVDPAHGGFYTPSHPTWYGDNTIDLTEIRKTLRWQFVIRCNNQQQTSTSFLLTFRKCISYDEILQYIVYIPLDYFPIINIIIRFFLHYI